MSNNVWKILGILALVGPMACTDAIAPTTQELLEGNWTWVESSGGITGGTGTPASTGETMSLRFLGTDSVEVSRNGALQSATTYQLRSSDGGATTVIEYAQGIFGFDTQDFNLTMDVLLLIDGCCDGYAYRFERAS